MSYPTFPAIAPDNGGYKLKNKSTVFESDLDGSIQTETLPGAYWTAVLTFNELSGRPAAMMRAFVVSLDGRAGRFWLPVPGYRKRGTALGSGVVSGANQTGKSLVTSGWTPNQALLFDYSDYIQIGNRLHMITAPAASDASGNATLVIGPGLDVAPADGASIITASPACLMMLQDDDQAAWDCNNSTLYNMSISCREDTA